MNMRECINICVQIQRQSWTAPTDYAKRTAAYEEAKRVCRENGYTGGTFKQLWNAATDQRTREDAK